MNINKKAILSAAFICILLTYSFVLASERGPGLEVSAEIKKSVLAIEIDEGSVNLGELTSGYANMQNITLRNVGTGRIKVQAEIERGYDPILEYLRLNTHEGCTSFGWRNVTEWSRILERPEEYGGKGEPINMCVWLNLKDYPENMEEDRSISTEVTFWLSSA